MVRNYKFGRAVMALASLFMLLGVACQTGRTGSGDGPSKPGGMERAMVVRVIDGDTIELEGGERVRYLGIDTPETLHE